jgi:large subunit ribosomal protein L10
MALTKEQKKNIVKELNENIANQKAMVFVSVKGLKASELFDLRNQLKESDCLISVIKKTLLSIAFKENKIEIDEESLAGQVALVFGFKDEITPAKISYQFSLKNENLEILGGFIENEFKTVEEIITLAKTPSKEELLARIIGSIKAPISGFANVLQGNIKGLVYVLTQIK